VKNLLDKAIIAVIPGKEVADIKFNMSTLINLLKTAESEYDIGIENGTITNIAEYQDAQGFVSSANELFNKTINNLNETMANNFTEIKDLLNQLNTSMSNKEDSKQISTTVSNIVNTIPKILNIQAKDLAILVSTDIESSEVINNIRSLLDQSIEKIKNSDYQNAETLVIEAYLDNFEFLEPEIAKHDESLMKDTEVLLREQLRNLIQGNANAEDIQKMVNNINTKLNEIEKILQ
jgi:high-affinity iron transporter